MSREVVVFKTQLLDIRGKIPLSLSVQFQTVLILRQIFSHAGRLPMETMELSYGEPAWAEGGVEITVPLPPSTHRLPRADTAYEWVLPAHYNSQQTKAELERVITRLNPQATLLWEVGTSGDISVIIGLPAPRPVRPPLVIVEVTISGDVRTRSK